MFAILVLVLSGLVIAVSAAACQRHHRLTAMAMGAFAAALLWRGADRLDWHALVNVVVAVVCVELGALLGAFGLREHDNSAAA